MSEAETYKPVYEASENLFIKEVTENVRLELEIKSRRSALKKGEVEIRIIVDDEGQHFEDTITIKGGINFSAYRIFAKMQEVAEDTENPDIDGFLTVVEAFPDLMMMITKKATFDVTREEFEEIDDIIKLGIFELIAAYYNREGGEISKK